MRPRSHTGAEDGVALPTALLGMLVLLMLSALFVAYATPQQRATTTTVNAESALLVAESAAELAVAALADPEQPQQPFTAPTSAPDDAAQARQWAIDQALTRVTPGCASFQRSAGGDGIAIVDDTSATIYGVGFLPDCESRTTTRVMRVNYDSRPLVPLPATVSILTGGDLYFDHANTRIGDGGVHANGDIVGSPGRVDGPYSAAGTCSDSDCTAGAAPKPIPNFTARRFWEQRLDGQVNPNNDPWYELCPDGTVQRSPGDADEPCDGTQIIDKPSPNWVFTDTGGRRTWTWTANAGPPDGQYYAYRSNIVNEMNNGNGNSSRMSLFAEATTDDLLSSPGAGSTAGSITFTKNPKFFPSWPGVGVVADVDVMVEQNLRADGQMTLVFAREQFRIDFNGSYDRLFFMSCDASLLATNFDPDDSECSPDTAQRSSGGSPIDTNRFTRNATVDSPPEGEAIVPNLGITGVGDWEAL
ncbi:MAG: hypothetical protein JJT89_14690 [Nitriliruptoraceae bacterium]|nr:hypothetical protein [Nitriliruptoraceae bacterium]